MKLSACCLLGFAAIASCAVMQNKTIPSQYSQNGNNTISFFCLGDWGKSSTYGSRRLNGQGVDDDDSSDTATAVRAYVNDNASQQNRQMKSETIYQKEVAAAMANYAENSVVKPKWVEALGDNFYKNGVTSTSDSLWTYLYTNVYLIYSSLQIPFYPVLKLLSFFKSPFL